MRPFRDRAAAVAAACFLFLAFAGSAVAVILLGAEAQRSAYEYTERCYDSRTVFAFISEKLRQGGEKVYTGYFGGSNALFIESALEGAPYTDIIYVFDGRLCELFCEKGALFTESDGTVLAETGPVVFSEPAPGLVCAEISGAGGETEVLYIYLRSGDEI